ncbi:MAG: hypothetical protein H7145_24060 [Akkermansiaceae bacterium]|nr:hypothetical protein [Armatimonadota bacterium]
MDFGGVVNLSRRLLVNETVQNTDTLSGLVPLFVLPPAFETLRLSLSKTIGAIEFQMLLSRALVLAKREIPWLQAVRVRKDSSLEGLVEAGQLQTKDMATQGCVILLSHVLTLLMIFVGEGLTLTLVRDALPDIPSI